VPPVEEQTVVFRSRFNRILAAVFWGVCAAALFAIGLTYAYRPTGSVAGLGVASVVGAVAVFVVLWRPQLTVSDDAIVVRNVFSTVVVPWKALIHVDTKYALTLITPQRKIAVWCAPAPGATAALRASRAQGTQARAWTAASALRPGDLADTESGRAAFLVRSRWAILREQGRIQLGVAGDEPVRVQPHIGSIAALIVGVVAVALATILL
jgi:hypothetical protein